MEGVKEEVLEKGETAFPSSLPPSFLPLSIVSLVEEGGKEGRRAGGIL